MEIGAPEDRVAVGGNLKFDLSLPPPPAIVERLKHGIARSGAGPVLVCGSTVEGEENMLMNAFREVLACYPSAVMFLAPRRPERFAEVERLLHNYSAEFFRRSEWDGAPLNGGVVLLDSIGELSSLYALADLAVVGGSLVSRGGHNILEPALYGVPIVVGPYTENFRDIVSAFQARNAVRIVTPSGLTQGLLSLLENEQERQELGRRALETLETQRGATQFMFEKLKQLVPARGQEAHNS